MYDVSYTSWINIYNISKQKQEKKDWDTFAKQFATFTTTTKKDSVEGFGPYCLTSPPVPCYEHGPGDPISHPHRCGACVWGMTALVYDADKGTPETMRACLDLLHRDGLAYVMHSTFSGPPSYRLIIPLGTPLKPEAYPAARLTALRHYKIPADPRQCSGLSHFYYMPSKYPGVEEAYEAQAGTFYEFTGKISDFKVRGRRPKVQATSVEWEPPESTTPSEETVRALRFAIKTKATYYEGSTRYGYNERGAVLQKLLAGQPLANHGARNSETYRMAGILTWLLPGHPASVYLEIMRPSVEAMIAAGSRLSLDTVEGMILSGMRSKWAADEFSKHFSKGR